MSTSPLGYYHGLQSTTVKLGLTLNRITKYLLRSKVNNSSQTLPVKELELEEGGSGGVYLSV